MIIRRAGARKRWRPAAELPRASCGVRMHGQQRGAGPVSLGHKPDGTRIRRKVTGRTKTEVRDKLREVDSGLRRRGL